MPLFCLAFNEFSLYENNFSDCICQYCYRGNAQTIVFGQNSTIGILTLTLVLDVILEAMNDVV